MTLSRSFVALVTWAATSHPLVVGAAPVQSNTLPKVAFIPQILRPAEVRAATDKWVVRSQFAILEYFYVRRAAGLVVYTDGYSKRLSMNRATALAIRREFDARTFPSCPRRLTERQRAVLLTNGGTHVAWALGLIRGVRPAFVRRSRLFGALAAIVPRGFVGHGGVDRSLVPMDGPAALVLASDRTFTRTENVDLVRVNLPNARVFAEYELVRARPTNVRTVECAYQLYGPERIDRTGS